MTSRLLVRVLRRPLLRTMSTERAERSFFVWGLRDGAPPPYTLSTLGILNGFLKRRPKRLVVRGTDIHLEHWPPPKDET